MITRSARRRIIYPNEGQNQRPEKSRTIPVQAPPGDGKTRDEWIPKKFIISVVLVLLLCHAAFFLWPLDFQPKEFHYKRPPRFEGPLTRNALLSAGKRSYEGLIQGPESIAVFNGHIYTGTANGKVLDLFEGKIRELAHFGSPPCNGASTETTCGRPLGLRIDTDGSLVVVDTALGLYRVHVQTGEFSQLFSSSLKLNGYKSKFLNDVAVSSDGKIYVSDGSVKWSRPEFKMQGLELNPDGRIIEHDPQTNKTTTICDNVYANGLQVAPGEDFLVVCETPAVRLLKCYIRGPKRGLLEVFLDNLPGYPDNIRRSSSGGYWVALTGIRQPDGSVPIWEKLAPYPFARSIMYKWEQIRTNKFVRMITSVLSGEEKTIQKKSRKSYGMVLEINTDGEILRSLHDPTGNMVGISHAEESDGNLFLGSASNDFIGVLDLH